MLHWKHSSTWAIVSKTFLQLEGKQNGNRNIQMHFQKTKNKIRLRISTITILSNQINPTIITGSIATSWCACVWASRLSSLIPTDKKTQQPLSLGQVQTVVCSVCKSKHRVWFLLTVKFNPTNIIGEQCVRVSEHHRIWFLLIKTINSTKTNPNS